MTRYMRHWSVYLLKNAVNDKGYVGITAKQLPQRLEEHIQSANPGRRGPNGRIYALQAAIQKHGGHSFSIELLEEKLTLAEAQVREGHWIKRLQTFASGTVRRGYNMSFGGEEPDLAAGDSEVFELYVIAETDKAILVSPSDDDAAINFWLPRSQIEVLSEVATTGGSTLLEIEVPPWLVQQHSLADFE